MGKSLLRAVGISALLLSGAASAQEFGAECRAEVRAQMRGPKCRMATVPGTEQVGFASGMTHPCLIPSRGPEYRRFSDDIVACVAAGGPKKWLAGKGKR